jgi:hypothetical protein
MFILYATICVIPLLGQNFPFPFITHFVSSFLSIWISLSHINIYFCYILNVDISIFSPSKHTVYFKMDSFQIYIGTNGFYVSGYYYFLLETLVTNFPDYEIRLYFFMRSEICLHLYLEILRTMLLNFWDFVGFLICFYRITSRYTPSSHTGLPRNYEASL